MNRTFLTASLLSSASLLLGGCQSAAPDRFAKADADGDGRLTRGEVSDTLVSTIFETRDADGDGKLTKVEWEVPGDTEGKAIFRDRDANRDGIVTIEEAKKAGRKKGMGSQAFDEADTDKDGFVTRDEARAYSGSKEGPWR
jgi:Ca2+-binding EF-hand superfamily protein